MPSSNAVPVLFRKSINRAASIACLCVPMHAVAIVSMEDVHLGNPPQGFSGKFALDLSLDGGNTEQGSASTGAKFQWTRDQLTDFILLNYDYGESNGVTNKNKGFAHYRHIHQLDARFAREAFTQLSTNRFTALRLRALIGGGVRLTLGEKTDKQAFFLGLGAFYEHEKLDTDYPDEADTEDRLRASTYLVIKYQFNDYVGLVSSTYYQPDVADFADYRTYEDLSVVSKLTDNLSLTSGVFVAHDSKPPRDVKQTDYSLKLGLLLGF